MSVSFCRYVSVREASLMSLMCMGRLKRRLERIKSDDGENEAGKVLRDFDNHIETGFQLATFQGPLCAEPVKGLAYFVESVEINQDALQKERGMFLGYDGMILTNRAQFSILS